MYLFLPPPQVWGYICVHGIYIGAGKLSSGPLAFVAGILGVELSPQLLGLYSENISKLMGKVLLTNNL